MTGRYGHFVETRETFLYPPAGNIFCEQYFAAGKIGGGVQAGSVRPLPGAARRMLRQPHPGRSPA